MVDFSAFPVRKTNLNLWIKIPSGLAGLSLLISFVFISRPDVSEREIGIYIFQITTYVVIAVLAISLFVISIWFIKYIFTRFIRTVTEGYGASVPAYNNIYSFEKFSLDNGYEFIQYPFQTPAPYSYYEGLVKKSEQDDIYVLYQIQGIYEGTSFSLYCLASAEGKMPGLNERRGMAYAYDTEGRRIEYATVLSTPSHIPLRRFGSIKVLNTKTHSFIFCSGYLTDRNTLKEMFDLLGSNR